MNLAGVIALVQDLRDEIYGGAVIDQHEGQTLLDPNGEREVDRWDAALGTLRSLQWIVEHGADER
jgi:hypothetical protein